MYELKGVEYCHWLQLANAVHHGPFFSVSFLYAWRAAPLHLQENRKSMSHIFRCALMTSVLFHTH